MNSDERRQSEELFHRALELPVDERGGFLARSSPNEIVRAEVERLLSADADLDGTLDVESHGALADGVSSVLQSAPPIAAIASGTLVAGHFEIIELLGRGAMGDVYLARDRRLGRRVALKFLSPSLARDERQRTRFLAEARAASALNHPHVCIIHEIGEHDDGSPFLAFELLEGEDLDRRLARGPIPIPEVLTLAAQLGDALDAAHSAGLVHRDVKPSNLHLTPRGQLKVLDFGLAKRLGGPQGDLDATAQGSVLGTPLYMSPEQALGHSLDARSDLFSVGVVLYEMVTGRRPFQGESFAEVAMRIVHSTPDPIVRYRPEASAELERIVLKCLQKNPEERYPSARDLLVDLRRLIDGTSGSHLQSGASGTAPLGDSSLPGPRPSFSPPVSEASGESDVFISYAAVDDHALPHETRGWIASFHRNLEIRIEQLSGDRVRIWRAPGAATVAEVPGAPPDGLDEAKTMVSIVSPPFVKSTTCCEQVARFRESADRDGRLRSGSGSRLFKVVKRPVPAEDIPPRLDSVFRDLVDHDFFDIDPLTGRVREYSEAGGREIAQRYHERIYDLAEEISGVLRDLKPRDGEEDDAGPLLTDVQQKTFYLATTTSELERERDRLRRELLARGHVVLPDRPLPLVGAKLTQAVKLWLERADYSIHTVGGMYGVVPEGMDESVLETQNRLAADRSRAAGLDRLIWVPPGLEVRDPRQAAWIEALRVDPAQQQGAELIEGGFAVVRGEVIDFLEGRRRRPGADAGAARAPRRLFLICVPEDERAVEPIEDFFFDRDIEVVLPAFGADEVERQDLHIRSLSDCDAVLVFFGAAEKHWVEFTLRDVAKAAGYRDRGPIGLSAVLVAPPLDRRKERFRSLSAEVIRGGEELDPGLLEGFADRVREVRR